jgi:hypothetical protein
VMFPEITWLWSCTIFFFQGIKIKIKCHLHPLVAPTSTTGLDEKLVYIFFIRS